MVAPTVPVDWFRRSVAETAAAFDVDPAVGLSSTEVASRLQEHGRNELDEVPRRAAWKRFLDQFNDLLIFILLGAAAVSAAVGDLKDPIVIGVVLLINATMGFVQENRADNALDALKGMLETTVRVRRDGTVSTVPASEIVPGDLVLLEAGDKVPADGRFVLAASTTIDESMLTGESVPVDKDSDALAVTGEEDVALADRVNLAYMNSTVTRGRAELIVTDTGMQTEMGRLAGLLEAAEDRTTPLQEQIDELGKRLALIAGVAVLAVFVVALIQADTIDSETVGEALLNSVALAVAAIPEGLPAVVTVTLAIGVSRLAGRNAIVKRLPSVETLGSTTVICSDKTGTLTLNQMTATAMVVGEHRIQIEGLGYGTSGRLLLDGDELDVAQRRLVEPALIAGVLCNDAHLRVGSAGDDTSGRSGEGGADAELVGDPTEGALVVLAAKAGLDPVRVRGAAPRAGEVPFESSTKFMATLHPHPDDPDRSVVVVKGAPDVVLGRCSTMRAGDSNEPDAVVELDDARRGRAEDANHGLGSEGLRVLALASRELPIAAHEHEGDLAAELVDLRLEALVGILDPARPEAIDAIRECGAAGIRVKMITGDHASTAGAIAAKLGIEGRVVSGAELDEISDDELPEAIGSIGVCARVSPEHKVRVVKALQARREVVAMTGDGVNDAASLKQAEIGVAMGITGTEVTKEAGDMILTDDNFATIVTAVRGGRAIYDNIITFVRFQLTTNISAILTILIAQLAGFGGLFNAIQILFVNIIADGPPAIALGVDPPKPGVMDRPPRPRNDRILSARRLVRIGLSAVVITVGTLGTYLGFRDRGQLTVLTMAFTAFVFFQLVNSFCVRSGNRTVFSHYSLSNQPLLIALAVVVAIQVAVVQIGFLQGIFDTTSLALDEWLWVSVVPLSLVVVEEIRKAVVRAGQRRDHGDRSDHDVVPAPGDPELARG